MLGWFKALSVGKKVAVIFVSLFAIGTVGNIVSPPTNNSQLPAAGVSSQSQVNSNLHKVQGANSEIKTITETQPVPFQSTTQNDSSMASGTTKITTPGVNGVETITYKVTYVNGAETSREKVSDVITTQPISQVTSVGTYVAPVQLNCPNGTYVNTAGNTVCSPYSAPSAPSGATAQCRDGTYSFSQSRSGTCSHHGGVATWL